MRQSELEAFDRIRQNTVRYKIKHVVGNSISNLARICSVKSATGYNAKPLLGQPAVIVAAGPSLDKNIGALIEAQQAKRCPFVIAVNTAAPALRKAGVYINATMALETVDISSQLDGGTTVVSLASHPNTFSKATHWFAPFSPHNTRICRELRAHPLHIGDSVATSAVSLALDWGANTIILMGQDLAYTGGQCYATGTPWENERAVPRQGQIEFQRPESKSDWQAAQGVPRSPEIRDAFEVEGHGGEKLWTTTEMVSQIRWYEGLAKIGRFQPDGHKVRFINATEGGAMLPGWSHETAKTVLWAHPGGLGSVKFFSPVPSQKEAVFQALHQEVAAAQHMANAIMQGRPIDYVQMSKGLPFIGGLTLGATLSLTDNSKTNWTARQRMVYRFQCWLEAANVLSTMLHEVA